MLKFYRWRVFVVVKSLHTKNRVERLFELTETFQFLTASVLPPHLSDLINPIHLVIAEVLTTKPRVNRVSLLYVLIVSLNTQFISNFVPFH